MTNCGTKQSQAIKTTKAFKVYARNNYRFYIDYIHKGIYQHGKHTQYICEKLEQVEKGEIKRLMIFLPPRHSKSMTTSETFPSYYMGKNPDKSVILVSYGDKLARKFGRSNLEKLEQQGQEIFDIKISNRNASVTDWGIQNQRGRMVSAGIGGSITGEGADLLIIDDPIKNRKEADSITYRDMVWDEWQSTLYTRLQPGGAVILIMTRWHEDDLAGRLLNPDYGPVEDWDIIQLPAEAEEGDILGRKPGEALSPERGYDQQWLENTKIAVGSRVWTSLYQQKPTAEEGTIFHNKWFNYYTETPTLKGKYISVDATFKDKEESDYVVFQSWGVGNDNNHYLLDQMRGKYSFTKTVEMLDVFIMVHKPNGILIEDAANGPAIINTLENKFNGIIPITPQGSKESRARAVTPMFEAGNVFLPKHEAYLPEFKREMLEFPHGKNDDQVDAATQYLNYIRANMTTDKETLMNLRNLLGI